MKKHSLAIIIAITTFMTYAPMCAVTITTFHIKANACHTRNSSFPVIDPQWGIYNPNSAWDVECPISLSTWGNAFRYTKVAVTINAYNRADGGIVAYLTKSRSDGTQQASITCYFSTNLPAIQKKSSYLDLTGGGGSLSTLDDYIGLRVVGQAGQNYFTSYDVEVTTNQ